MDQCTSVCTFHRDAVVSSVTLAKTTLHLCKAISAVCATPRPWRLRDTSKKSLLHLAASQGKVALMEWYLEKVAFEQLTLEKRKMILNEVDGENGWTALHRCFYQGEIAAAYFLLKRGADLTIRDHDGYTPLQLLIFDNGPVTLEIDYQPRHKCTCCQSCSCCILAFFTWGTNSNFTLGFGDDHVRTAPDKVKVAFPGRNVHVTSTGDLHCANCQSAENGAIAKGEMHLHQGKCAHYEQMDKSGGTSYLKNPVRSLLPYTRVEEDLYTKKLPILDVVLRKFHSLFLTPDGSVYSCGHGQGGRLGQSTEKTVLVPTRITFPIPLTRVVAMSAGLDHSVFLTDDEHVYVCGSNEHGQLGVEGGEKNVLTPSKMPWFGPKNVFAKEKTVAFDTRDGQIGVAADRYHTLIWTGSGVYACGRNIGQLGPTAGDKTGKNWRESLTWKQPREVAQLRPFSSPARFVRTSDAATLCCGDNLDMMVLHDYETRRLPRLPLLSRVQRGDRYQLTELAVFGGNLHLPSGETEKRELVIVALAYGIPLLLVDGEKRTGYWRAVSIQGIPRDMSSIHHLSLSFDCLLLTTTYGECYSLKLSKFHTQTGVPPVYSALRVPKVWRALKVFSEPGSRNFAVIQVVGRSKTPDHRQNEQRLNAELDEYFQEEIDEHFDAAEMFRLTGNETFHWLDEMQDDYRVSSNKSSKKKSRRRSSSMREEERRQRQLRTASLLKKLNLPEKPSGFWDIGPDVRLICDDDDQIIHAHRAVLIQKGLYFRLLLEGKRWRDWTAVNTPFLPCDLPTGLRLLELIYSGSLQEKALTLEESMKLLRLADFLIDEKVREYAGGLFEPYLNHDQLFPFYRLAQSYSSDALNYLCIKMMGTMIPELLESHQFETLTRFTADQLDWFYKEQPHLHEKLLRRVITPHESTGLSLELIEQTPTRNFALDVEYWTEMHSVVTRDEPKSGTKKTPLHPVKTGRRIEPKSAEKIEDGSGDGWTMKTSAKKPQLKNGNESRVDKLEARTPPVDTPKVVPKPRPPRWDQVAHSPTVGKLEFGGEEDEQKVTSLSAIMAQEAKHTPPKPKSVVILPKSRRKFVGQSLDASIATPPEAEPTKVVESRPKGNPWAKPAASPPTMSQIMTDQNRNAQKVPLKKVAAELVSSPPIVGGFAAIQQDEAAQLAQLKANQRRPLGLIQIEERAIDELLEFYGALDNAEEWISVERVLRKQADALWSARV